ncbi:reverse transcriptase [Lasius niger]|uniref:Reverse transcriptase n=1 Tax=Lasius niger TaxID=67767 RepID=A0A0J7N929_LASNI|nr:reverse transcriptase [Lasius niger]
MPPLRFLAPARKRIYEQVKRLKNDEDYTKGRRDEIKVAEHARMYEEWRTYLGKPNRPGEYTKMAIVSWLEVWMGRKYGSLSFHFTQLMTGYGCFAKFLHRIGKRATSDCDFCGEEDDVMHTSRLPCMGYGQAHVEVGIGTTEGLYARRCSRIYRRLTE